MVTQETMVVIDELAAEPEAISGWQISHNGPVEHGNLVALIASVAQGSHVSYVWDLGDGQRAEGAIINHLYAAPGVYTVRVTASNALGSVSAESTVQVNAASAEDAPISGLALQHNCPCEVGMAVNFATFVSSGSNVHYQWDFGDGTTAEGALVKHEYATAGSYLVQLTASNRVGTSDLSALVLVLERDEEAEKVQIRQLFLPLVQR